jgi:hypothetical protein
MRSHHGTPNVKWAGTGVVGQKGTGSSSGGMLFNLA